MTPPIEPYRPRRIEPLGVVERAGWMIKVTGITASADLPDDAELAAALEVTEQELPQPDPSTPRERNSGPAGSYERDFRAAPGSRADDSFVAMWGRRAGRGAAPRSAGEPDRIDRASGGEPDGPDRAAGHEPDGPDRTPDQTDRAVRHPGVGFCIVHRGAEALWVLVCWWERDLMYERLWRADLGSVDLRPVPPDGPTACVWELQVIGHERQAWIDHVLTNPSAPDVAGYLAATLTVAGSAS